MNANGTCAAGDWWLCDQLCQPGDGFQGGIERRGDRGGEKAACPPCRQKSADGPDRAKCRFHHVVPGGAVEMHVKKRRSEQCAGKIQNLRTGWQGSGLLACDGLNVSVFACDDWTMDEAAPVPESFRGDYQTHRVHYCRRPRRGR